MDSLPREILKEITKRLPLRWVAHLAQTCKSFNASIWSLITTINEDDLKKIKKSTRLDKFNNLESLSFGYYTTIIPQDLTKLTTLQKLYTNINPIQRGEIEYLFGILRTLTNLRELNACYPDFSEKMDDLLNDHTRLTKLEISAHNLHQLDPLSWEIMTRLRYLKLNCVCHDYSRKKLLPAGYLSKLWTLTQLRGLDLGRLVLDQQQMETGLSKLTNLEELSIYACTLKEEDNRDWMINYNALLDLKKLTSLEIVDLKPNDKLIDIIANMTQLMRLDILEFSGQYKLSVYSNLKNLTQIWFGLDDINDASDPGLDFTQIPNLEVVSVPWCQNVTQLVHLKKLRELSLQKGSHKNYEQVLNFLNELDTLPELSLSYELLPSDGIVDMKGMTNLMYLEIDTPGRNDTETKSALESVNKFVRGLSSLPSLVSLYIAGDITQELFQTIATSLTQLRTLKLRKNGRDLFKDDATENSQLPSHKNYRFDIEFMTY